MEILRTGSSGDGVEELQKKLLGQGISPGPVDGVFGSKTEDAVKQFQTRQGLKVDGIAGLKTFTALGMTAGSGDLSDLAEAIEAKKDDDADESGGARTF
jgi:peptidoglycan hydrolase-like protein with peptidoglycan-binding domain